MKLLLLVYVFSVVAFNSPIVHEYYGGLYFLKHLSIISYALLGIVISNFRFSRAKLSLSIPFILLLIYEILVSIFGRGDLVYVLKRDVFILLFITFLTTKKTISHQIFLTYSLLGFLVFFGVLHILNGDELFVKHAILGETNLQRRLSFGFNHPGLLASHLALIFYGLSYDISGWIRILFRFVIKLSLVLLVYCTNAQNALLIMILYLLRRIFWKNMLGNVIVGLTGIALLLGTLGLDKVNVLSSGRLFFWGLHLTKNINWNNVLFGTAPGKAVRIEYSNGAPDSSIETFFHVDNYWIEVFIENGLFGLSLLLFFVLTGLSRLRKAGLKQNYIYLIAISVYSFFDSAFISTGNLLSVFLWLGIMRTKFNVETSVN